MHPRKRNPGVWECCQSNEVANREENFHRSNRRLAEIGKEYSQSLLLNSSYRPRGVDPSSPRHQSFLWHNWKTTVWEDIIKACQLLLRLKQDETLRVEAVGGSSAPTLGIATVQMETGKRRMSTTSLLGKETQTVLSVQNFSGHMTMRFHCERECS